MGETVSNRGCLRVAHTLGFGLTEEQHTPLSVKCSLLLYKLPCILVQSLVLIYVKFLCQIICRPNSLYRLDVNIILAQC